MHLASADFLAVLTKFVEKVNQGEPLTRQHSIAPWVLESKLSGMEAKVLRTYEREYKKFSQARKKQLAGEGKHNMPVLSVEELKQRHKKMQKAASDLFIDQVREKIGPFGGSKLKGTFVEQAILKH